MRTLTYVRQGVVEWRERADAALEGDGDAVVRPVAATTCDLDQQMVRGRTPFAGPFSMGHEAVAEIVDLGDGVSGLEPGQQVIVPFHIACGTCERCEAGLTAHCLSVPYGAMFGVPVAGDWGGLFDDLVRVPFAASMLVPVPPGVDLPAAASAGDNLPLALEAVAGHLRSRSEADMLILGTGSIGLFAIEVARALGTGRVVYVDGDDERRRIASDLGAETAGAPPERDLAFFDLVLDAAGNADWLRESLRLLKPEGTCESVGGYFEDVSLPLFEMFVRGTRFRIARGNAGPNIRAALEMIAGGAIAPDRVISEVLTWDEAPAALIDPSLKPLFLRDQGVV